MKPKNFIGIGECTLELQSVANGLYRLSFAGDTLNTAWYVRALMQPNRVVVDYLTAIGTDQLSSEMKRFLDVNGIGTTHINQILDRTVGLYLITLTEAERSFTYWRSQLAARLLTADEARLRVALVRVQASWDRLADLNKGGFLVHRSHTENRNETEIRSTRHVRTGCEGHSPGDPKTIFG